MLLIPNVPSAADIPNWVLMIGAGIGSAAAAYVAQRAKKASDKSVRAVEAVNTELNGPTNEPSLRELVKDHQQQAMEGFVRLHGDAVRQGVALEDLKQTVSKDIDGRLRTLETNTSTHAIAATAISSLDTRITQVAKAVDRHGVNMHLIANAVQVKLLTPEEVDAILKKKAEDDEAARQAQTIRT